MSAVWPAPCLPDPRCAVKHSPHIVTADTSGGFPTGELSTHGVIVAHPNGYYTHVAREYPDDVRAVAQDMASRRATRQPGFEVDDLLDHFDKLQMPDLAAQLRR